MGYHRPVRRATCRLTGCEPVDESFQGNIGGGFIAVFTADEHDEFTRIGIRGHGDQGQVVTVSGLAEGLDGYGRMVLDRFQVVPEVRIGVRDCVADVNLVLGEPLPEGDGVGHCDIGCRVVKVTPGLSVVAVPGVPAAVIGIFRIPGVPDRPPICPASGRKGQVEGNLPVHATAHPEMGPVGGIRPEADLVPVFGDSGDLPETGVLEVGIEGDHLFLPGCVLGFVQK